MNIVITIDGKDVREIVHDDAVFAFSLAHQALTALQEEAGTLVQLVESPAPAPSPEPSASASTPAEPAVVEPATTEPA